MESWPSMEKEESIDVGITIVSSEELGPSNHSSPEKISGTKRLLAEDTHHLDINMESVKKPCLEEGLSVQSDGTVVVLELTTLDDHEKLADEKLTQSCKDDSKMPNSATTEYFEFIKPTDDYPHDQRTCLTEKESKSPLENGNSDSDREGLNATQQQYYIAVDARTVATLQAGTEYTLVPVDQAKHDEERSSNFEEESRSWVAAEPQIKASEQPQQLLMQTMKPLPSTPSSPQAIQQESTQVASQIAATESFQTSSHLFTLGLPQCDSNNMNGKSLAPLPPMVPNNQTQMLRGCQTPMAHQMKFETSQHFHNPNSHSNYQMMPSPHPHLMYNMGSTTHHPSNAGPYPYPSHRLHLPPPPPNPGWHSSPYSQNYSPHSNQNYLTPQPASSISNVSLNSSGEETENVSPDYPRIPHNTPNTDGGLFPITTIQRGPGSMSQILGPLDNMQYFPIPYTGRENHNEKERKRRSRIKNACSLLRDLVPGLSEKTDKATVFEYTVQYLLHLKRHIGKQFDKEFMEKYTPY